MKIGLEIVPPSPKLQDKGSVEEGTLGQAEATDDAASPEQHLLAGGRRQRQDPGACVHV